MKRNSLFFMIVLVIVAVVLAYPTHGVPILAYHMINDEDPDIYAVSKADFEKQMRFLAEHGYQAISLAQMMDGLNGKIQLPAKPIVITFDDGYIDNYTDALPVMERYGMKGTVFMIAGQVGEPGFLTWQQLRDMQNRNVEIGSHTVNHIALSEAASEQRETELVQAKAILEQQLGSKVEFLAYPFGQYDKEIFSVLEHSGYRGACTGKAGLNLENTNPYSLKRINMPKPKLGLFEFRVRLLRAELYGKLNINN